MSLVRHLGRAWDRDGAASTAAARAAFVEGAYTLLDEQAREAEIARLPTVIWRGRTLYTLRCRGEGPGRGPHLVNVPGERRFYWKVFYLTDKGRTLLENLGRVGEG